MIQANFYLLKDKPLSAKLPFVCRLINQVHQQEHRLLVLADTLEQADSLNQLLWTFQDISFIPHALHTDKHAAQAPIVIATEAYLQSEDWHNSESVVRSKESPIHHRLINLTDAPAANCQHFKQIFEIMSDDPLQREQGRKKYAFYRAQEIETKFHEITS